jgi:hypothetical protein
MTIANSFFNKLKGTWQNKLNGEWQDSNGWNFINQPKIDNPRSWDFKSRVDQMRETIVFKPVGMARNIGVTGEAGFWDSMAYEISVETPAGDKIHQEMGHFMMAVKEDGETEEALRAMMIRQATIPRANAFMTEGELRIGDIQSTIDRQRDGDPAFYTSRALAPRRGKLQENIDRKLARRQNKVSALDGPNLSDPLPWLQTILPQDGHGTDWEFSFRDEKHPTSMASGQRVMNPVTIGNLLSDFWIGDRDPGDGLIEVLQYAQAVNLEFNYVEFPHIAVNTLVKQPA